MERYSSGELPNICSIVAVWVIPYLSSTPYKVDATKVQMPIPFNIVTHTSGHPSVGS